MAKKKKKSSEVETEVSNQDLELGSNAVSEAELQESDSLEVAAEVEEDSALVFEEDGDMNLSEEESSPDFEQETSIFLKEEADGDSFLPEVSEEALQESENEEPNLELAGTELDAFESAAIEEQEFVEEERLESIVESILFASDRPVSLASLKMVFKGTNIRGEQVRRALDQLAVEYAGGRRGVTLEEVPGGYQLRTKIDNLEFLRRTLKTRSFKLSGPALEVLSIVAYKQPIVKAEIDEIRGVESGHLLRALMEKNLVNFEGKSELPGRPMQYGTTKKFLEIFGLRNLKELPTLSQIDELLPEGIGEDIVEEKPTLSQITDSMSENVVSSYSQGEDELMKIQDQLEEISTSSQFFEDEKKRQQEKRDQEKAQNIREALALGEPVSNRDANWLKRYDEALAAGAAASFVSSDSAAENTEVHEAGATAAGEALPDSDLDQAIAEFDAEEESDEDSDELLFTEEADDIDSEAQS